MIPASFARSYANPRVRNKQNLQDQKRRCTGVAFLKNKQVKYSPSLLTNLYV